MNADAVVSGVRAVATRVEAALRAGELALVLGGDCTVGVGTVAGAVAAGAEPRLVYLDLHADLNTPSSVPDGALDWTGLAHLLSDTVPELPRQEIPDARSPSMAAYSRGEQSGAGRGGARGPLHRRVPGARLGRTRRRCGALTHGRNGLREPPRAP